MRKKHRRILNNCIDIAFEAHQGQKRKWEEKDIPYIRHPVRVMQNLKGYKRKSVAVLHDVVEDTHISFTNLFNRGVPSNIIDSLKLLTHDKEIPYEDYIRRIIMSNDSIAISVKIEDILDNLKSFPKDKTNLRTKYHLSLMALSLALIN